MYTFKCEGSYSWNTILLAQQKKYNADEFLSLHRPHKCCLTKKVYRKGKYETILSEKLILTDRFSLYMSGKSGKR